MYEIRWKRGNRIRKMLTRLADLQIFPDFPHKPLVASLAACRTIQARLHSDIWIKEQGFQICSVGSHNAQNKIKIFHLFKEHNTVLDER